MSDQHWALIGLATISTYAVYSFYRVMVMKRSLQHILYFITSILFVLTLIMKVVVTLPQWPLTVDAGYVTDTFQTLTIASLLSALAVVVRDSKPIVTRFPLALSFIPFLLVPSHLIVSHTFVLKELLFGIYQAGAIIVGLLIYGLFSTTDRRYLNIVAGIVFFAVALVLDTVTIPFMISAWIIWGVFAIAVILISKSYKTIIRTTI
jgi:hypothetical protein